MPFLYIRFLKQEPAKWFTHIMFTAAQLASFGNFLFEKYDVYQHSTDGKNTPLFHLQVSDADYHNWIQKDSIVPGEELPSKFQRDQFVQFLSFRPGTIHAESHQPIPAVILSVHFHASTVKYDIELDLGHELKSRIYNVEESLIRITES